MTIRVLWVIKGLGPGGAETLLLNAARAHDHTEFDVECAYVLAHKDHLAEQLERAGVRTHCLSRRADDRCWPIRLRQVLVDGHFDVVHFHSPMPAAVGRAMSLTVPTARRPKRVTTEHNAWNTYHPVTRWANRLTTPLDDAIFAVSEEIRSSMGDRSARRAVVLLHGIDVASVAGRSSCRAEARAELDLEVGEFVIGTVANYRPQKDYPTLLRAFAALERCGVAARLVAIGQGPSEGDIVALRQDLGLDSTVLLTGFRADATRLMSAFDVFTLASRYEGLPVALMEALALGLPVVATSVGGVAETLDDDAILVPPGDPTALAAGWKQLFDSPERRADLAARARVRADDFDVRRSVSRYEETYRLLAPEGVRPAVSPSAVTVRRVPVSGVTIRAATPDDRPRILEMLARSLGWTDDPSHAALFSWKHDENPFGPSPMWVATDKDRVVGLRAFMRWNFGREGQVVRAVRAVDTATDPDYQGHGLFTALTLQGIDALEAEGIDFVFNTPNDQSLPGYLKMGWRDLGRIPIAVRSRSVRSMMRTARSRVGADLFSLPVGIGQPADTRHDQAARSDDSTRCLTTLHSGEFLRWRYDDAPTGYRIVRDPDATIVLRGRRRGAASELVMADVLRGNLAAGDASAADALGVSGFDHVVRCGRADVRRGFIGLPGLGPRLTVRPLCMAAVPPAANWSLSLGDVELF